MIRKSKGEFERNDSILSKSNPKIFWSRVRSKFNTKTSIVPPLQDEKDGTSTKSDEKKKVNILQKQFVGVFTKQPKAEVPALDINI